MESIAIQPVQLTITTAFPADSAIKFVFLPRRRRGRNVFYLANRNGNAVNYLLAILIRVLDWGNPLFGIRPFLPIWPVKLPNSNYRLLL